MKAPVVVELIKEQIARGQQVVVRVGGYSMAPFLWPGVKVRLASLDQTGPCRGDIVAIERQDRLVFHLIYHTLEDNTGKVFFTRGIGNLHSDPPARQANLVGKVVAFSIGPFSLRLGHSFARNLLFVAMKIGPAFALARHLWLWVLSRMSTERLA